MSNPDTSFHKSSNEDIDKEVRNLIRKNAGKHKSSNTLLDELRDKYGKDRNIIGAIIDKYNKKMLRVKKLSQKIKERLLAKYPNLSIKEYIRKIDEYKSKYDFDDSEAQAIINEIFMNKNKEHYNPDDAYSMANEMTKALGFVPASNNLTGSLNIDKDQTESLQHILQHNELYGDIHNQVILQSLIYEDIDHNVSVQPIERNKINIFSFVHPVVAALFLPKIDIIDQHMLIANIAKIIYQKYNGIEIQTQPEYELYWDIATDPAETACVTKSKPFDDLLKRCVVQCKLMEAVLSLRQGKFYMNDLSSFILAIDNCRASVFDAADLAYVKDEGTILRKLLAAFSLRPTIVLTRPVYSISSVYSNIPALASGHITTLPMITIRLPSNSSHSVLYDPKEDAPTTISQALKTQQQLYIHHRQIVQKQQEILHSREILIFYVHRRFFDLSHTRLTQPYNMVQLPNTISQFEKLNKRSLTIEKSIKVGGNDDFKLKSFVSVQTKNPREPDSLEIICCTATVLGNKGGVIKDTTIVGTALHYEPLQLDKIDKEVQATTWMQENDALTTAGTHGTIFIYHNAKNNKDCDRKPDKEGAIAPKGGAEEKEGEGSKE